MLTICRDFGTKYLKKEVEFFFRLCYSIKMTVSMDKTVKQAPCVHNKK